MQIAYRAFATVQQRQLYIAKVDSIEKLFYNAKMASLRRPEIGRQAQRIGRNAELRVTAELREAGWATKSNAKLDYAKKTDIQATCLAGEEWDIQVSIKQKSPGEQGRLKKRGVIPVSIADLDTTKQTAPEFLCSRCPLSEDCRYKETVTDLGSTAIALMQAHKA